MYIQTCTTHSVDSLNWKVQKMLEKKILTNKKRQRKIKRNFSIDVIKQKSAQCHMTLIRFYVCLDRSYFRVQKTYNNRTHKCVYFFYADC